MKIKGYEHHAIYLVQNCDLLPPVYIVDRALECIQGE